MRVRIAYGRGDLDLELPDGLDVRVLEKQSVEPLADPAATLAAALESPIDAAPLRELARGSGAPSEALGLRFFQEGSLGMSFAPLAAGTPIELEGMHPEHPLLGFPLPEPPALVFDLEGQRQAAEARLITVIAEPSDERVSLVYAAQSAELPRCFLPGIHPRIPVALQIDGGASVRYQAV